MIASVLILALAGLIAQFQHYAFMNARKTEIDKSELDDLKTKVAGLQAAQGFKR